MELALEGIGKEGKKESSKKHALAGSPVEGFLQPVKLSRAELYKEPTNEELTRLRETESLFHSSLLRLQVEELLKEVRLPEKKKERIDAFLREVNQRVLKVPSTSKTEEILQDKDGLNQRYFRKRALYLAHLAHHLGQDPFFGCIRFSYTRGCHLKPSLLLRPHGKDERLVTVRLHPCPPPDFFRPCRLLPSKNNVRSAWYRGQSPPGDGSPEPPTPHYNTWVLQDVTLESHVQLLSTVLGSALGLRDGVALLKVWLRQRELDKGLGGFSGFLVSMLVVFLVSTRKIHTTMSGYQVLRSVLQFLATTDLTVNGISLCLSSDPSLPALADFHQAFPVVFLDSSGYLNLCADVTASTYHQVQHEARLSMALLDGRADDGFQLLLMTPKPMIRAFDHVLHHANIPDTCVHYVGGLLDALIQSPKETSNTGEEALAAAVRCYDDLSRLLWGLEGLPLTVSAVQGAHPVLRYTEVFPPTPVRPAYSFYEQFRERASLLPRPDKPCPAYVEPMTVVCHLEGSGQWPQDAEAIRRVRAAFQLRLAELLTQQHGLQCRATATHTDVLKVGFLRFLFLVSTFDWKNNPLIVNLNNELTVEEQGEIRSGFLATRTQLPIMVIVTPQDRKNSIWTQDGPSPQVLQQLVVLAAEALPVLEKQLMDPRGPGDIRTAFRPPLDMYDVLIRLSPRHIPRHRQAVDSPAASFCRGLLSEPGPSSLMPVLGYDPPQLYLAQLREAFGDLALFFYDQHGGEVIGVLWKPSSFQPQPFKASNTKGRMVMSQGGELVMVPNVEAILEDLAVLGEGLVQAVEARSERWTV
ncbi:hypothetical protein GH733_011470 [Mirounga leonina]|nr:hypothetical protein GH733_011470 [Mirounga leonina]